MKAFWLPSKTPEARQLAERPQMDTICPATGKKLKLKDLTTVNFTRVPEGEDGFAMDPVTKDTFTNASRLAILKPTGMIHNIGMYRPFHLLPYSTLHINNSKPGVIQNGSHVTHSKSIRTACYYAILKGKLPGPAVPE